MRRVLLTAIATWTVGACTLERAQISAPPIDGGLDAGMADAGRVDVSDPVEVGPPDVAAPPPDLGPPDVGQTDAGQADTGCQCGPRVCGEIACGLSCGSCEPPTACSPDGQCVCEPRCEGRVCGDDGCGSTCGACESSQRCESGQCATICGGLGEPCCSSGMPCGTDGACLLGTCACGIAGLPCCGDRCDDWAMCVAGQCSHCGGFDQPCCPGSVPCSLGMSCQPGQQRCRWDGGDR